MKYPFIEKMRRINDITQKQLSKQLGITAQTYRNWQNGVTEIPASHLISLSQLFDCSVDSLLTVERKPCSDSCMDYIRSKISQP